MYRSRANRADLHAMRVVRIGTVDGAAPAFGAVRDDHVVVAEGHPFGPDGADGLRLTSRAAALADVRLLAPVLPSKVLCVGRNYAAHARELGNELPTEPLIFFKPSSTRDRSGPADRAPLALRGRAARGRARRGDRPPVRRVPVESALDVILGATCANDVTARDLQRRDGQWTRGKGFDTFCPLGPWIDTDFDVREPARVQCRVDGEVRQDGTTGDLVFDIATLIAWCSAFCTLLPGDVLLTGTPAGVGPLPAGCTVEVEVERLGVLSNPVVAES